MLVIVEIIGFGVFLWLGLYLMVRSSLRAPAIIVSLIGLFGQAAFFFAGALTDVTTDTERLVLLERWIWWTTVLPAAAWLHLSALIAQPISKAEPRASMVFPRRAVIAYTAAGFLILFGTVTDLFVDYSGALQAGSAQDDVRPGPAYPVYMLYLVIAIGVTIANFALALRQVGARRDPGAPMITRQLWLLIAGSLCFIIGSLGAAIRYNWSLALPAAPAYLLLIIGLAMFGYGVAHYGMLLDGKNIERDFLYNFTGIALVNIVYTVLLSFIGQLSTAAVLALVGLVTLSHMVFDFGRRMLDRVFFTPAEQVARAEARLYATALGTTPVATTVIAPPEEAESDAEDAQPPAAEAASTPSEAPADAAPAILNGLDLKAFRNAVRRALTNLKSPPQLADSPLLILAVVERRVAEADLLDNRLNRVATLREVLIEQIEGLKPEIDSPGRVGDAWRFYNVLHYPYVRELSRKGALAEARRLSEERRRNGQREPGEFEQVLNWLADVDEDTFYKWQRRASDTIANMLWEEQMNQRGP
jgi:hypothetical protein